jgi:major membrane immunogen (membrane-anchored lipoprotein)
LVKTQDVNFGKYKNAAGNTDAISGASIMVKEFFELSKKAIASAPVAKGQYSKDGWYFASAPDFDKSGWKANVLITVANGSIVDAIWNGLPNDRKKKSKIVESEKGATAWRSRHAGGLARTGGPRDRRAGEGPGPAAFVLKKDGQNRCGLRSVHGQSRVLRPCRGGYESRQVKVSGLP